MFILELVMQGVRGFRELVRFRFQPRFNFVAGGNEKGKTASVDTVQRLLFPDQNVEAFGSLVSYLTPEASRAALVVAADDGAYYRVIQDFSRRGVNLAKYNGATKEFSLLKREWKDAAEFMSSLLVGMNEEEFSALFIFRRGSEGARKDAPVISTEASTPAERAKENISRGQEARLAELREQLKKAEEAADVEYRLETAKIRLAEIAKKLEDVEVIEERVLHLRQELSALTGCDALPENLAELLDAHEQRQGEKMMKCDDLRRDIDGLNEQLAAMPSAVLWKDPLFLLGAAAGAASLVAGLFILTEEYAHYFPIGILASLLFVAAGWYNSSRKNAQRRLVKKTIEELEAELSEVEKSFEEGGEGIMSYMQATGSTTAEELREKSDNYRHFRTLLAEAVEEQRRILAGATVDALREDYSRGQQEVIGLERAASAVAQYAVDTYSIRQEIERIECETGASPWGAIQTDEVFFGSTPAAVHNPGRQEAVILPELRIASRVSGIEMNTLVPAVEAAAQRNFAAATGGKYVRLEAGHDGDPAVYDRDDRRISYTALSHGTRDLLYFCLRAGLVEALAGKLRQPFVLDDPFIGLDPTRRHAACQILRGLSAKTQVILFTSDPALKAEGDAFIELK